MTTMEPNYESQDKFNKLLSIDKKINEEKLIGWRPIGTWPVEVPSEDLEPIEAGILSVIVESEFMKNEIALSRFKDGRGPAYKFVGISDSGKKKTYLTVHESQIDLEDEIGTQLFDALTNYLESDANLENAKRMGVRPSYDNLQSVKNESPFLYKAVVPNNDLRGD